MLLYARTYTLALRSKADPAPLPGARIRRASDFANRGDIDRYVLDPAHANQLAEFSASLATVWKQGGWTVYFDELYYLSQLKDREHRFETRINQLLTQGRSNNITVICGVQRPAWVSLFAPSQATHLIAFRHSDLDLKRLREVGNRQWAEVIESLNRYEFAWLHRPTREMWRGYVQDLLPKSTIEKERARA